MTTFFVFGSLMDMDILSAVLGREVQNRDLRAARADGFKRVCISGVGYPAMLPSADASTDGVAVSNLSRQDVARLAAYEGSDYEERPIALRFADGSRLDARYWHWIGKRAILDAPWDFEGWRQTAKPRMLSAARAAARRA